MSIKISLFLLLALSFGSSAVAQQDPPSKSDTELNKYSGKYLLELLKPYPEAYGEMKHAVTKHRIARVSSLAGSFLIGYSIGTVIKKDPRWIPAGIGASLFIIAIPLHISYKKQAQKALDLYEEEVKPFNVRTTRLEIGGTRHGLGLVLWL